MKKQLVLLVFLLSINIHAVDGKKDGIKISNLTKLLNEESEESIIDKEIKETSDKLKRVIAVSKDEWLGIKSMIAKLDVPQRPHDNFIIELDESFYCYQDIVYQ